MDWISTQVTKIHSRLLRNRSDAIRRMRLDFIIVGVQKAGTTALHNLLRQHPNIFMPRTKELHFFDSDSIRNCDTPDYLPYHRNFLGKRESQLLGEATPIYIYWPGCMSRIKHYNPDMRLIVSLRNPVHRAYSHWRMEVSRGREQLNFSAAIREGRKRVLFDEASLEGCHRVYSYVERSFYAPQIKRMMTLFPEKQMLFLTFDQLRQNPESVLDRLCDFLQVPHFERTPSNPVVGPENRSNLAPLSENDRSFLLNLFQKDIDETSELTKLDLAQWKR